MKNGIKLKYVNSLNNKDVVKQLLDLTDDKGYDDVFVFAPFESLVEQANALLAEDGCAGPSNPDFSARFNFHNVHYWFTHVVGTSGGNDDDLKEALY